MKVKQKVLALLLIVSAATMLVVPFTSTAFADCGGVKTSILNCSQKSGGKTPQDTGVWGIMVIAMNILTAGVGILAVGGITYAAILYASSSDNAAQTKQAKDIIKNVVIGIVAYGGMYLLLNFLIPGGIFT